MASSSRSDDVSIRTEPTDGLTLMDSRGGESWAVPPSVIYRKPSHTQPRLAIVPFALIVGHRQPQST